MSAKLILNLKDYDASVTKAKIDLHWLPIPERIEYKILILFLSVSGMKHICKLLSPKEMLEETPVAPKQ